MAMQIVMDHNGDTRHYFDPNDADALAKAEERFKELTGQGFTAAVRITSGEVAKISSFKPMVEQTFLVLSAIIWRSPHRTDATRQNPASIQSRQE